MGTNEGEKIDQFRGWLFFVFCFVFVFGQQQLETGVLLRLLLKPLWEVFAVIAGRGLCTAAQTQHNEQLALNSS
jgi:hypothetical protein